MENTVITKDQGMTTAWFEPHVVFRRKFSNELLGFTPCFLFGQATWLLRTIMSFFEKIEK